MSGDMLYAEYVAERQGLKSIWKPWGFVVYRIVGPECFMVDMHITKSERRTGKSRQLAEELASIARELGCELITANIYLKDPGANQTLAAALAQGFEVKSSGNDVLLIAKEIRE